MLPALRAHLGDWMYYICFLKMRDIAERISYADEIHTSRSLKDLLQRQVTERTEAIKKYLLAQEQRFFNALVIGTYGGSPRWNELAISSAAPVLADVPGDLEGSLGILTLEGSEKLFAIDGQHRIVGIRAAVRENAKLGEEEVCVLFVKAVGESDRLSDPAGFERTRRLFTTLNRYAKPVSKRDIIALDEDDVVAIVTRELVENDRLFQDKVSTKGATSLSPSDKRSLTTIVALYDAADLFLRSGGKRWHEFKRMRPDDSEIAQSVDQCRSLWRALTRRFPQLRELESSAPEDEVAGKYRHEKGGHLFFRPIGLLIVVRAIRRLIDGGVALTKGVARISKVPLELAEEPWVGLLWDATNQRMITAPANQKAAFRVMFHAVGGDLRVLKTTYEQLRVEVAGLLHRKPRSVKLRRYVQT